MARNIVKRSQEEYDALAHLRFAKMHIESIEMFAKAGREMLAVGVEPPEIIDMVFNSILSDTRRLQKDLKHIAEKHDAELRDSGFANPSRSLVAAAHNDAAVLSLIKRASKKTPIRGK